MNSKRQTIIANFDGGTISCDAGLISNSALRETFALAFDHGDANRSGAYFIRSNGEIVRVGGAKLPAMAALLASIGGVPLEIKSDA